MVHLAADGLVRESIEAMERRELLHTGSRVLLTIATFRSDPWAVKGFRKHP